MTEHSEHHPSVSTQKVPDIAAPATGRGYLRIEELAAYTGVSISTIRRLWRDRKILGFQPGGPRTRVVFPPDALESVVQVARSTTPDVPDDPTDRPQRGPRPNWLGSNQ